MLVAAYRLERRFLAFASVVPRTLPPVADCSRMNYRRAPPRADYTARFAESGLRDAKKFWLERGLPPVTDGEGWRAVAAAVANRRTFLRITYLLVTNGGRFVTGIRPACGGYLFSSRAIRARTDPAGACECFIGKASFVRYFSLAGEMFPLVCQSKMLTSPVCHEISEYSARNHGTLARRDVNNENDGYKQRNNRRVLVPPNENKHTRY